MSNYAFDALLSKLDFDSNNHVKNQVVRSNNKMNFQMDYLRNNTIDPEVLKKLEDEQSGERFGLPDVHARHTTKRTK